MADVEELTRRIQELERRVLALESPGPAPEEGAAQHASDDGKRGEQIPEPVVAAAALSEEAGPIPPASRPIDPRPARNWEAIIGGAWLNRIGIAAVLIAVAYFLKHAFENEWIGPAGRVLIGAAAGIGILVWSEVFQRRGARIFSHSLKVLGVGILYLSIWAAAQYYELIPLPLGFGAMAIVTAAIVALALRHDSEFLAALAMTSGFLTPVLLSTGENRPVELFSWILLLDVAALVLLAIRPWVRLFAVNYFGTTLLFIGWMAGYYTTRQEWLAAGFATLFFVVFALVPVARKWRDISPMAVPVLLLLPMFNGFVFFAELSGIFRGQEELLTGFALVLGAVHLGLSMITERRMEPGRAESLPGVHLVVGISFFLIAVPLAVDGEWITIGWLAAAGVLLYMHERTRRDLFAAFCGIALGLGLFRLLLIDTDHVDPVILNSRFLAHAIAVGLFVAIARSAGAAGRSGLVKLAVIGGNWVALVGLTREASDLFVGKAFAQDFTLSALWMAYGAGMMVYGFLRRSSFIRWLALIVLGFTIGKVFLYDLARLERIWRILSFFALGALLLAISFAYQKRWLEPPKEE